jgi:hypothetical protein
MLHARARSRRTTISELVRQAVRECYVGKREERIKAMAAFVGIRKTSAATDTAETVRRLRRGSRIERLSAK